MKPDTQEQFALQVKTILLRRRMSIADLGRSLNPKRPRSTISVCIHTKRFPKAREQVKGALGL